jgi:hypothetical protein
VNRSHRVAPDVWIVTATTAVLLTLAACSAGGSAETGSGGTSSPAASPTGAPATTAPAPATASSTPALELDDEAQACLDAMVAFLVDIEDLVAAFDFERASLFDYGDFIVAQEPAGRKLAERVRGAGCTDAGGAPSEELVPYIRELVEREAPGSMPYLDLLLAMKGLRTSGICQKDQATLLRYMRDGGTVSDLPVPEKFHAFSLAASIDFTCGLRGAATFFDRDDVARFLEVL